MAFERRRRLTDGRFGPIEKVGEGLTDKEKLAILEAENLDLKLALVESVEIQAELNTQTQLAVAELAELILLGGEV